MTEINNNANLIWGIAELLRGDYKQSEYGRVILPLVVMRRLDQALEGTKPEVLDKLADLERRGIDNMERPLRGAAGFQFFNKSPLTFPHQALSNSEEDFVAGKEDVVTDAMFKGLRRQRRRPQAVAQRRRAARPHQRVLDEGALPKLQRRHRLLNACRSTTETSSQPSGSSTGPAPKHSGP